MILWMVPLLSQPQMSYEFVEDDGNEDDSFILCQVKVYLLMYFYVLVFSPLASSNIPCNVLILLNIYINYVNIRIHT